MVLKRKGYNGTNYKKENLGKVTKDLKEEKISKKEVQNKIKKYFFQIKKARKTLFKHNPLTIINLINESDTPFPNNSN